MTTSSGDKLWNQGLIETGYCCWAVGVNTSIFTNCVAARLDINLWCGAALRRKGFTVQWLLTNSTEKVKNKITRLWWPSYLLVSSGIMVASFWMFKIYSWQQEVKGPIPVSIFIFPSTDRESSFFWRWKGCNLPFWMKCLQLKTWNWGEEEIYHKAQWNELV